jgi:hypothetical protein
VAQLSGSVGALAKNADAAAPGASIVAPAAVNIVGWLFGTALDQQRFESLKAGVTAVGTASPGQKAPIATVATTLGAGLVALSDQRVAIVRSEVNIRRRRLAPTLSDADYRQGLNDLEAAVTVLHGLRQTDPQATAQALVEAHARLLDAINDPGRNYPSLLKAVGDFADQASALQAAFAAANPPAKASTSPPAKPAATPPAKKGT